jgi:hypothetical protein
VQSLYSYLQRNAISVSGNRRLGPTGQRHKTIIAVCECAYTAYPQPQLALDGVFPFLGLIDIKTPGSWITIRFGWMFIFVAPSRKRVIALTCTYDGLVAQNGHGASPKEECIQLHSSSIALMHTSF